MGKRLFVCLFVRCVFRSCFVKKIQLPGYIAEPRSNKKMMGEVPRGFFLSPPPHRFLLSAWVHLLALTGTRSPAGPSIMKKNFVAKGVVSALLRLYMVSVAQKVDSAIHLCILSWSIGTLRSDDGDGNGSATKAIGLISKTTILHVHHAFLYISLPSLHDYDVKMPNLTMYRESTLATTKFPLSFWTWIWFLGIQLGFAYIWQSQ